MRRLLRSAQIIHPGVVAFGLGLLFGIIDVHFKADDPFDSFAAYFIAGLGIGLIHSGRAWQAWAPLSIGLYLMHRVAIAWRYQPPYVEENTAEATRTLLIGWPVGFGLALGVLVRLGISC